MSYGYICEKQKEEKTKIKQKQKTYRNLDKSFCFSGLNALTVFLIVSNVSASILLLLENFRFFSCRIFILNYYKKKLRRFYYYEKGSKVR